MVEPSSQAAWSSVGAGSPCLHVLDLATGKDIPLVGDAGKSPGRRENHNASTVCVLPASVLPLEWMSST
jgi:hypothetical protein